MSFIKAAIAIIGLTAIGTVLLDIRHKRVLILHDMAITHKQIDDMRHAIWDSQVAITEHVQPQKLEASILHIEATRDIKMEPNLPSTESISPENGLAANDQNPVVNNVAN